MKTPAADLTLKKIFLFWLPLAATWLMMSVEGPFIAAIIARLGEVKYNLAAYGVAFSLALIIEAPVIMIMSASTALVKDRISYKKLRNFTNGMNVAITAIMLILCIPAVFYPIAEDLINLPAEVARLTHLGFITMLPWPAAIGIRRFYQGILIRNNLTRLVAYGTVTRLIAMIATGLALYFLGTVEGVVIGTSALSMGVTIEAIASRFMVHKMIKKLLATDFAPENPADKPQTYSSIAKFYYPLALTPMIALTSQPIVIFFVGQGKLPLESLAVFPVIHSLIFVFRSMGISYMEVTIACIGENNEGYKPLRNFAAILAFSAMGTLGLIAFTPLADIWFGVISGLTQELTDFSKLPTQIFTVIVGLSVLQSFQRGILVNARITPPITFATLLEAFSVIVFLIITIHYLDMVGVVAGVISLVLGRLAANLYLFPPFFKALNKTKITIPEGQSISN